MKTALYMIALLLLAGAVQAQAYKEKIRKKIADKLNVVEVDIEVAAHAEAAGAVPLAIYTTPEGEVFTVEATYSDSLFVLSNPKVETRSGRTYEAIRITPSVISVNCPAGFEATYVGDETEQYQMGYCTPRIGTDLLWSVFRTNDATGNSASTLPFIVAYPAREGR